MKYNIISPDGFSINREGGFNTVKQAMNFFYLWKNGFEKQGYYSSVKGSIQLNDLAKRCTFRIQDPITFEALSNINLHEFNSYNQRMLEAIDEVIALEEKIKTSCEASIIVMKNSLDAKSDIIEKQSLEIQELTKELDFYKGVTNERKTTNLKDLAKENIKDWCFDMFVENYLGIEGANEVERTFNRHVLGYAKNRTSKEELYEDVKNAKKERDQALENTFEMTLTMFNKFYDKFGQEGVILMLELVSEN